jgi:hypothetical protein
LLTKRQPREHRTHTPSNRIRPCGELMPPELFGSTTIDCSACMEKANTRGAAGATGAVVALARLCPFWRGLEFISNAGPEDSLLFDDAEDVVERKNGASEGTCWRPLFLPAEQGDVSSQYALGVLSLRAEIRVPLFTNAHISE